MSDIVKVESKLSLAEIREIAAILFESEFFPDVKSAQQAAVKIMAGQELGIGPFASMTNIHIIDMPATDKRPRKVSMQLGYLIVGARLRQLGYDWRVVEHNDRVCVLDFYRGTEVVYRSVFTLDDANRANLTRNPVWQSARKNLLFARALTNGQRFICPQASVEIDTGADEPEFVEAIATTPVTSQDLVQYAQSRGDGPDGDIAPRKQAEPPASEIEQRESLGIDHPTDPAQPEPEQRPAPTPPEKMQRRADNGDGKRKPASVSTAKWSELARALGERVAHYQDAQGRVSYHHMTMTASLLGYAVITDSNCDEVMDALEQHARERADAQAATE